MRCDMYFRLELNDDSSNRLLITCRMFCKPFNWTHRSVSSSAFSVRVFPLKLWKFILKHSILRSFSFSFAFRFLLFFIFILLSLCHPQLFSILMLMPSNIFTFPRERTRRRCSSFQFQIETHKWKIQSAAAWREEKKLKNTWTLVLNSYEWACICVRQSAKERNLFLCVEWKKKPTKLSLQNDSKQK